MLSVHGVLRRVDQILESYLSAQTPTDPVDYRSDFEKFAEQFKPTLESWVGKGEFDYNDDIRIIKVKQYINSLDNPQWTIYFQKRMISPVPPFVRADWDNRFIYSRASIQYNDYRLVAVGDVPEDESIRPLKKIKSEDEIKSFMLRQPFNIKLEDINPSDDEP